MGKIESLNRYQKVILLLITIMVLVFTVIYPITIAREGFAYKDAILVPHQENNIVVYSGKLQGKPTSFTVFADKTVEFQYGDQIYGPYTAREDPTAIPKDKEQEEWITGVELQQGEKMLFRGGVLTLDGYRWLYNEDGSLADFDFSAMTSHGMDMDVNENETDSMEPSVSTLLALMDDPPLSHKGNWVAWFGGVLICIMSVLFILFADTLFRRNLSFRIRDAERAEPSDFEIASRYITWTALPIMALLLFVLGLVEIVHA